MALDEEEIIRKINEGKFIPEDKEKLKYDPDILNNMAKKKKGKTVEDILNEYHSFHSKSGKSFKERIGKFEDFHDPENIHQQQFLMHAHYSVFGKPTDAKGFPGAFNQAYKVLDKHAANDNDKLTDVDKLTEIIETYVDSFLEKAEGKKYRDWIAHAKEQGMNEKEIRGLKQHLFAPYLTNKQGKPIPILDEGFIKNLKGTKKIELIGTLQQLGEGMKQSYAQRLMTDAIGDLISEDDRLDMAKYITPKFKGKGWKTRSPHIVNTTEEQLEHYLTLLSGDGKKLQEMGYKAIKKEKKPKK